MTLRYFKQAYGLMTLLLAVDTAVFVLQKIAADHAAAVSGNFVRVILMQPALWIALALALVQLYLWTRILKFMDLSLAYPISSLATPMTMLVSQLFLHEQLGWLTWLGALLMTLGVVLMGSGHTEPTPEPESAPAATEEKAEVLNSL